MLKKKKVRSTIFQDDTRKGRPVGLLLLLLLSRRTGRGWE